MNDILTIQQLSKSYGKIKALKGLDLHVPQGSVYGILGPNGSGKTTTLGIVLGILFQNAGHFKWFGEAPHFKHNRRIGSLLETPNFYPYLNAMQNLNIIADIKKRGHERIQDVLKEVNLFDRRKSAMSTYSLGMKQRLALAAALLSDPDVLVLDEPTNGLDPQGIADVRAIIKKVGQNKTIILASHILDEVEKTCTHVAVLKNGQKLTDGSIANVLGGQSTIEVSSDDLPSLKTALSNHPAIQSIESQPQHLILQVSDKINAREINHYLYQQNIVLSYLNTKHKTLESTFLELISEDKTL